MQSSLFIPAAISRRLVKSLGLTLGLLWFSLSAWAISEGGAIFLLIRPGARASGMGSAFCAIADDATATYFNPAGLAFLAKEDRVHLTTADIKNWPQLARAFQGEEHDFLLDAAEISQAEELAIVLANSPLVAQSDLADPKALLNLLKDGDPADPNIFNLRFSLGRELLDSLSAMPEDSIGELRKALARRLNRLLNEKDLFQLTALDVGSLPDNVWESLDRAIYTEARLAFTPQDIVRPNILARRLKNGQEPAAAYIYKLFSARAKSVLAREAKLPPDSLGRVLASELSRIARTEGLYQKERFQGVPLKPITSQLAALSFKGEELARFNLRLISDLFCSEIEIRFDRSQLGAEELRLINRRYMERVLGSRLRPQTGRPGTDDQVFRMLALRLEAVAKQILDRTQGLEDLREDEANSLADGINRAISDKNLLSQEEQKGVVYYRANRHAVENALAAWLEPQAQRKPKSAKAYLSSRIPDDVRVLLEAASEGKELAQEEQLKVVAALNALIDAPDLYQPEYFPRAILSKEARSLAKDFPGLSQEKLLRFNRLLLESLFSGEIAKVGAEAKTRYATLMHSPWLSEIWGDVGDMYYEFLAYAQPVKDWGVFGGNLIFLSEGKNQHIDENNNVLGEFSSYEFSPTLSYGNRVLPDLGAGLNLKVIHSHLAPFGAPGQQGKGIATTWAVDLGLLYHTMLKGLSLGVALQNIGPKLVYIDAAQADPLSRNLRLGFAYRILDGRLIKLTTAGDITRTVVEFDPSWSSEWWKAQWQETVKHFGLEYVYHGFVQLALRYGLVYDRAGRIGTKLNSDEPKFSLGEASTFGGSVGYKNITFDIALEPGGELMNGVKNKKFALSFNF